MTTIFEALRADHETQRRLVDRLVETTGDSDERRDVFGELRIELAAHAAAEERYFYVPLIEHDLTQQKARHSIAEHHELDELVEQLAGYEFGASRWLTTAKQLHHRLHHHLDEEEQQIFQQAGKALSDDDKTALATRYTSEMSRQRADD